MTTHFTCSALGQWSWWCDRCGRRQLRRYRSRVEAVIAADAHDCTTDLGPGIAA